ncbi:MAG: DUF4115 domain-containing protein [Thiomonas sp.]|uniref:helix-turn-helix domain-containing protein n=1 Tax=Thiomonas sp. TaxID=2047785 RepID=UPI002A364AC8|nr:RodZ domain-containing protein [Thiomonas sp.]MDY0329023.1 DUF4115 domain-containing protein [Thiomonas sp.]
MTELAPELIASRVKVGAALREARMAAGRNVEELAAQLKVSPAKISALEAGDWSALPDDTFGRALLRSCCKALKIDAQPLLDLLPGAPVLHSPMAEEQGGDLAQRVPERPLPRAAGAGPRSRGLLWLAVLIIALAALVFFWPALRGWTEGLMPGAVKPQETRQGMAQSVPPVASHPAVQAASGPAHLGSSPLALQTAPAPAASPSVRMASAPSASSAPSAAFAAGGADSGNVLQLAASAPSWVQVTASNGRVIFSQLLPAGASQSVQVPLGSTPLSVVVGNAPHTTVTYAGKPVDLAPATRANVARFTLK